MNVRLGHNGGLTNLQHGPHKLWEVTVSMEHSSIKHVTNLCSEQVLLTLRDQRVIHELLLHVYNGPSVM